MMSIKTSFYVVFTTCLLITSAICAERDFQQSDDLETPDVLLENIDIESADKKSDTNIDNSPQEDREKDQSINKPDPLEKSLQVNETSENVKEKKTVTKTDGDRKAVKKRRENFSSDEQLTPDPLLDNVD